MGGISEAMHFNVPMLLLPKTIEQQLNARYIECSILLPIISNLCSFRRIKELGGGIDLRSQSVSAAVLKAVR